MLEKTKELNLLYIEDNENTRINYMKTFEILFNKVSSTTNYAEAIWKFQKDKYDIVLIDIELNEKKDGFDIANKIKKLKKDIKVIFLTAHDEPQFILKAINSGMNGYIVKPLDKDKLLNIISTLLINTLDEKLVYFKNFKYNFDTYELFNISDEKVCLGKKENSLLQYFLRNKNRTVSREELEYEIWAEPQLSDSTLKNIIASLRRKMGKDIIVNESKIGWRINID